LSERSREYWDNWILQWDRRAYDKIATGIVERVAAHFSQVDMRLTRAVDLLKPYIKTRAILDLGCGTGRLAFALVKLGASRVYGVDFSERAIGRARESAHALNLTNKVIFVCDNVVDCKYPEVDVTVGLGLFDYLDEYEINKILSRLTSQSYLFTYLEKRYDLRNILNSIYLSYRHVPRVFKYSRSEIERLVGSGGPSRPQFDTHFPIFYFLT
jgi:SAM-dependent methyltransferase